MTANKFLEDSMNGKDLHEKEKMLKEAANKPQDDKNNKPGLYYASGSRDKVIKICETATGRCITTLVSFFKQITVCLDSHFPNLEDPLQMLFEVRFVPLREYQFTLYRLAMIIGCED
jgi:hypothetical protein